MPKLIRINLQTRRIQETEIEVGNPLEFYAGRSLSSKIISEEVLPDCDPLSEANKLIFAVGFLNATRAPNSGRLSIGSKSPLTGGIKESNVGGRAPALLGGQDIRGLVFEGSASDWVVIVVKDGQVTIQEGTQYTGLNNYELDQRLLKEFGEKIGVFSIGTAGEFLMPGASIASMDLEGYPSRHAGRGGLGAVMGSKKIKAVIVYPTKTPKLKYEDFDTFKAVTGEWFKDLYESRRTFSKFGTALGVMGVNEQHGLPTQNFRRGQFNDAAKICGDALYEYIQKNKGKSGISCSPGCAIQCSNLMKDASGKHITSSLEYETIALCGSNLLINDIEKIGRIDGMLDDIGLDSIEMGNTIAVLMEAGVIKWGDADGVIAILNRFIEGDEQAHEIGLGCARLAEKLGVKRATHVLKQGLPGYDPRTFKGMGVTFLTSPMGADHTAGPAIVNRKAYQNKEYGKLHTPEGKVLLSKELQEFIMILDSMGLCYFVGPSYEVTQVLAKLLKARYGWKRSADDWILWANMCLRMELEYNRRAGLGNGVSQFPPHLQNEPQEDIPERIWDVPPNELKTIWKDTL
jgi:aldehyde:ferredoxin oxidoreductase